MPNHESEVFIILTGVSGNLGDAVIRRRVLEWARGTGRIHAYVGKTTPGWIEELGFRPDETVYDAPMRKEWLRRLLLGRGKRSLIFDPGEVPLGRPHLAPEAMFAAITLLLRLRGATIVRPPRAIAHYTPIVGLLHRISSALSQRVLWRNSRSIMKMKVGTLVPDTAFHEPRVSGLPWSERKTVVVSLRGKRPYPPQVWFDAIRQFSLQQGLSVSIMSQVDEDEARSSELAKALGEDLVQFIEWGDRTDIEQEREVRRLYERAAFVVSDRLHVLILASIAGAQPIEVIEQPQPKVAEHFETIGMTDISLDTSGKTTEQIVAFLEKQTRRHDELDTRLGAAYSALDSEVAKIRRDLSKR